MTTATAYAFYIASAVALIASALAVTRRNVVHALMFVVVMFLALSVGFACLGAPFGAAVQIIISAGAIMVLFVFVVMVLDPDVDEGGGWRRVAGFVPAVFLTVVLVGVLIHASMHSLAPVPGDGVQAQEVSKRLFGAYALGIELASMLLLAGLVGAFHLARRRRDDPRDTEGAA